MIATYFVKLSWFKNGFWVVKNLLVLLQQIRKYTRNYYNIKINSKLIKLQFIFKWTASVSNVGSCTLSHSYYRDYKRHLITNDLGSFFIYVSQFFYRTHRGWTNSLFPRPPNKMSGDRGRRVIFMWGKLSVNRWRTSSMKWGGRTPSCWNMMPSFSYYGFVSLINVKLMFIMWVTIATCIQM